MADVAAVVLPSTDEKRLMGSLECRCALDIGSANHKLCVAEVDATNTIVKVLHAEQKQVMLKHALLQSRDGKLPDEILEASRRVLVGFHERALALGATRFAGVATAVFRSATNGDAFLGELNRTLNLRIRVISQRLEGELGWLSAHLGLPPSPSRDAVGTTGRRTAHLAPFCAAMGGNGCTVSLASLLGAFCIPCQEQVLAFCTPPDAPTMVAWDSGGGSFQLSARLAGALHVWEGPLGDSDVAAMLLRLQGRELVGVGHGARSSPNPVNEADARALVAELDAALPPTPEWLQGALSAGRGAQGWARLRLRF